MKTTRSLLVLFVMFLLPWALSAEGVTQEQSTGFDFAYYPPDQDGYGVSDGGFAPITFDVTESDGSDGSRELGSTIGGVELKAYYIHKWIVPALRWDGGGLTEGNNVTIKSETGVSPVSATEIVSVTATPIAFLQFSLGGMVGTGWNAGFIDGLGVVDETTGEVDDASFEGIVAQASASGTFQFDVAAIVPGDWNHVVTIYSPGWTYTTFSGAEENEAWSFETDDGTNYRGWQFSQTAFLGYQPPLERLKTVGIMVETERTIGEAAERSKSTVDWNPGYTELKIAGVCNVLLRERHSLTFLAQVQRERLPSEATVDRMAVQQREDDGVFWDAYRIAFSYRYTL